MYTAKTSYEKNNDKTSNSIYAEKKITRVQLVLNDSRNTIISTLQKKKKNRPKHNSYRCLGIPYGISVLPELVSVRRLVNHILIHYHFAKSRNIP